MLLYVTLVSLKRATYSKKKKGEGDEFAKRAKGGRRKGETMERETRRTSERPYTAKRTFIKLRNVVYSTNQSR